MEYTLNNLKYIILHNKKINSNKIYDIKVCYGKIEISYKDKEGMINVETDSIKNVKFVF